MFDKRVLTELAEANKRYEEEVSRILERMPGGQKGIHHHIRPRDKATLWVFGHRGDQLKKAVKRLADVLQPSENMLAPLVQRVIDMVPGVSKSPRG